MRNIMFIGLLMLSMTLINGLDKVFAQERCRVETVGGTQVVNYVEYYKNMLDFFGSYQSASDISSRTLREMSRNTSISAARHWINSCPTFFSMLNDDVLPQHQPGTGSTFGDILGGALLEKQAGSDIRRIHPQMKRWLNRIAQ